MHPSSHARSDLHHSSLPFPDDGNDPKSGGGGQGDHVSGKNLGVREAVQQRLAAQNPLEDQDD